MPYVHRPGSGRRGGRHRDGLVLAADLVGRRLFAPTELPVGVITGVIGGPYLLWLLTRRFRPS